MLPVEIAARLKFPGRIEKAFLNYLEKSGAKVNQSKTIASQILYHQKETLGQNSVDFFTGQSIGDDTNINGSFIRPESEHFVIYAIKCYLTDNGGTPTADRVYENGILGNALLVDAVNLNAVFSLTVNSVRLLKNVPLTEFDALSVTETAGYLLLNEPILWEGQTELKLNVKAKPGETFNDESLRFELIGMGLI